MGKLIFRQMFETESSTYTYLLADEGDEKKEAILIDPVDLTAKRDANLINELGLKLKYALNTHAHADHITGTYELRNYYPDMESVISEDSGAKADKFVKDGDVLTFGEFNLTVISTPGHTYGCVSYYLQGKDTAPMIFTGDAVLIRGCGRTDFQQGSSETLYQSVWKKVFTLPEETVIYPAHDYKGLSSSTVREELKHNQRFLRKENEFVDLMTNLKLPYPKKIDASLPRNMVDGEPI